MPSIYEERPSRRLHFDLPSSRRRRQRLPKRPQFRLSKLRKLWRPRGPAVDESDSESDDQSAHPVSPISRPVFQKGVVLARIVGAWGVGGLCVVWTWPRSRVIALFVGPPAALSAHVVAEVLFSPKAVWQTFAFVFAAAALRYGVVAAVARALDVVVPSSPSVLVPVGSLGLFPAWLLLLNAEGGATAAVASSFLVALAASRRGAPAGLLAGVASVALAVVTGPYTKRLVLAVRGPAWVDASSWYAPESRLLASIIAAAPSDTPAPGEPNASLPPRASHASLASSEVPTADLFSTRASTDALMPTDPLRRPSLIAQYQPPRRLVR